MSEPQTMNDPDMLEMTLELAKILHKIADTDPLGHPSETAAKVFCEWLTAAQEFSEEGRYFSDVLENYDITGRSNKDLYDLFEMLHPYVDIVDDRPFPDDEAFMGAPGKTFISLPTL